MAVILCNLLGAAFLLPLGMALGSFFELAADRLPRGESLIWPPSHCRTCGHRLAAGELIPILSYLEQRGRCRSCDAPIDPGMPRREALSGLAIALPWGLTGCDHPVAALAVGAAILLAGWAFRGLRLTRKTNRNT